MKPIPALYPAAMPVLDTSVSSASTPLPTSGGSYSKSNRRAPGGGRITNWMLAASTVLTGAFCLLYLTKPVIVAPSSAEEQETAAATTDRADESRTSTDGQMMPSSNRLPGETAATTASSSNTRSGMLPTISASPFEQTNLRVQHILTAQGATGQLAKIDIDVPVLYQSRQLRWSAAEVAEARVLLSQLGEYQEKSQALRMEGVQLLESWNQLVAKSIPAGDLRADSPTLPANQLDAAGAPLPDGLDTAESIQIQPAE